ncbi:MAG: NAD-dependent epimerase/dehydratase family protein [Alphaproteobacteria bacterium]|nr:NAD-dependent epimerase/dehydratase family protein [Alphaproteobacteria bacterium]
MSGNSKAVCLVGAGYISDIHAEALTKTPGVILAALVDPNQAAASALARKWGAPHIFSTAEEAIASGLVSRAHILVPPHLHRQVAEKFIAAKISVLIEKPVCVSRDECHALQAAISSSGTPAGVNQNYVYHPVILSMQELLRRNRFGRLQYVHCIYNAPLRQLAAGQFGHRMFQQPGNILLEQAVHPLSQITAIAGHIQEVSASAGKPVEISSGMPFYDTAQFNLTCLHAPAQLSFAVEKNFPFWQLTAVCDDGVIVGDVVRNRLGANARTRWLEPADYAVSGVKTAFGLAAQSAQGVMDCALAMARLKPRSDAFYKSMEASIRAFHHAVDSGGPIRTDVAFGARLVEVCEQISAKWFEKPRARLKKAVKSAQGCDVAVLGGTGFIGRYVVTQLVASGKRVAVEAAVAGSARTVAEACLASGTKRPLHIGTIAALYLGDGKEIVTGATPPDSQSENRGDYARSKAAADRMLLQMHRDKKLPVVILRPGVVVGEGSSPFHSGLGFFNNDQHCLGWNAGDNPLPFVLADDVAAAIVSACFVSGIEGKCYNLVGGAQLSARNYIAELGAAMPRPLYFHGQSAIKLQAVEIGKWLIKRAAGRRPGFPSYRDLLSRGMPARFDCSDARRDLNWCPIDDRQQFAAHAIKIFTPSTM